MWIARKYTQIQTQTKPMKNKEKTSTNEKMITKCARISHRYGFRNKTFENRMQRNQIIKINNATLEITSQPHLNSTI